MSCAINPVVLLIESVALRVVVIVLVALAAHLAVVGIRKLVGYLVSRDFSLRHPKARSLASLVTSVIVFSIYFWAVGFALSEFGVSLTAYLASATVIGLAVGFGSQGLVQDVVTGLTVVFTNLINVGDMVEVGGQAGIVKSIGMRFIVVENALGAHVFMPNRLVGNVMKYQNGYVRCQVDVTLPADQTVNAKLFQVAEKQMHAAVERFPGIHVRPPTLDGEYKTNMGECFLRITFRVWPGRGGLIETAFRQDLIHALQAQSPEYTGWNPIIAYEVEKS